MMKKWMGISIASLAALAGLIFAVAVIGSQSEVRAQTPDVSDQLNDIQDELTLVRSQMSGVRDDLNLARDQVSGVRGELALVRNQLERLTGAIGSSTSGPAAYTQTFVEEAINRYRSEGREATIAYYNTSESVDGDWYAFIIDENDLVVSHATIPTLVGTDIKDETGPDGYPLGLAVVNSATEKGRWVDYVYRNPNKNAVQFKHSWIVRHDGLIFGSGWYEDGPSKTSELGEYTKLFVDRAVHLYETAGRDVALDYYSTSESVDGDWYVFIIGEDDNVIVHPTVLANIGQDIKGPLGTDITGYNFGVDMLAATEDGRWVDYVYINPANDNKYERKHTWVVRRDGLIFGSGWYERDVEAATKDNPAAFTKAYVADALKRYDRDGHEATIAYYNTPESVDGDWYVFIVDENDIILSHPVVTSLRGTDIKESKGSNDYPHGLMISTAANEGGSWVNYKFQDSSGAVRSKHTWVVRYGGLIFGSGWYEDGPSQTEDPAAYTRAFVDSAIHLYDVLGRDATVAYYDTQESVDGDWYMYIVDEDDFFISYPLLAATRGTDIKESRDSNRYPHGLVISAAASEEGRWVDYRFPDPSGEVRSKHAWIVRYDGLIFGSGWYEDGPSKTSELGAYTKAFVERAIQLYETAGREAVLEYYNTMESVDDDWYLFAFEDGKVTVHPTIPANIGTAADGPLAVDITGYNFGADMLKATEEGQWIDYVYRNPANDNQFERKHSWVVRRDGLIFGSGWYERNVDVEADPAAYTKLFVYRAIQRYNADGRDATIEYYNTPESTDGPWYVFIINEEGTIVSHAARPERVGLGYDAMVDVTGYNYGTEFAATTEEGSWVDYTYLNPVTRLNGQKHSWVVKQDGLIFGSGWYEPIVDAEADPAAYTKLFVYRAIQRYNADGRDATIEYYNTPESTDGPWYVFIINEEGTIVSHAARPERVGLGYDAMVDVTGYNYGTEFAATTEEGSWVDYTYLNPVTRLNGQKHSWVVKQDGLIFGSGWYEE